MEQGLPNNRKIFPRPSPSEGIGIFPMYRDRPLNSLPSQGCSLARCTTGIPEPPGPVLCSRMALLEQGGGTMTLADPLQPGPFHHSMVMLPMTSLPNNNINSSSLEGFSFSFNG